MKTTVLFGSGQAGTAALRLLSGEYGPVCFADNAPDRQGRVIGSLPVLSLPEALAKEPDAVCLCVLDDERAGEMRAQLAALGYRGEVFGIGVLRRFDARVSALRMLAEELTNQQIAGDCAEVGVYRGDFAAGISRELPERTLHLFDTFAGFPAEDLEREQALGLIHRGRNDFSDTDIGTVRAKLASPERAVFHAGYFPETFAGCEGLRFALVSLDADLYAPTAAALPLFWERLTPGGVILIHDCAGMQYPGVSRAVSGFCAAHGLYTVPLSDLHGTVVLRKQQ